MTLKLDDEEPMDWAIEKIQSPDVPFESVITERLSIKEFPKLVHAKKMVIGLFGEEIVLKKQVLNLLKDFASRIVPPSE